MKRNVWLIVFLTSAFAGLQKTSAVLKKIMFLLTKPTAEFPPRIYRVEIWQASKEIYREPFEILP